MKYSKKNSLSKFRNSILSHLFLAFFFFILSGTALFSKTEISLPELIKEALPDMPQTEEKVKIPQMERKNPIYWPIDIWSLPGMDGFFRYPIQSLYYYLPSPYGHEKLALRYSYRIQYNNSQLPEYIIKFRHNWGHRPGAILIARYRFRYLMDRQILEIQDAKGNIELKTAIILKEDAMGKFSSINDNQEASLSLPDVKFLPRELKQLFTTLAPVQVQRQILGKYNQLMNEELFLYPREYLKKNVHLSGSLKTQYIPGQDDENFWSGIRLPKLSLSFFVGNDYKKISRIKYYNWQGMPFQQRIRKDPLKESPDLGDKKDASKNTIDHAMTQKIGAEILFKDGNDHLIHRSFIQYQGLYPVQMDSTNTNGEKDYNWEISYFDAIPFEEQILVSYYPPEKKAATEKDNKEKILEKSKGDTPPLIPDLFGPIDLVPGNLWGMEHLLKLKDTALRDSFLLPWPRGNKLLKEAYKKDEKGAPLLKVRFEYQVVNLEKYFKKSKKKYHRPPVTVKKKNLLIK